MNVAIVSNNPGQKNTASFVDSCDEVIRFSNCVTYGDATGSKITSWVTRSRCNHTNAIYSQCSRTMKHAVPLAKVAFIAHSFPEYSGDGKLIGPEIVPYDTFPVEQLCPTNNKQCVPINARVITLLHPGLNPTLGFIFLCHILRQQLFVNDKVHLIGWNFVGIDDPHKIDWEAQLTNLWIEQGYFLRGHDMVSALGS